MPPEAETKAHKQRQGLHGSPPSSPKSASSSTVGIDDVEPVMTTAPSGAVDVPTAVFQHLDENEKQQQRHHQNQFFFLNPQAAHDLVHYQYKGEDRSLLYAHVLSPLAQLMVDRCTPRTLAPNSITLIGLTFMFAAYCSMWYHVPTFEQQPNGDSDDDDQFFPPRWVFLANSIAILLYQTLDNMDGKQARRTGSSSPLGLLFDHGCDAINSIFGSANGMIALGLHPQKDAFLFWSVVFGPYAVFYIATWEEYFTGSLIMPIFNGPNEGLLSAALMSLTSWWFGPQFWQRTDCWDFLLKPLISNILSNSVVEAIVPYGCEGIRNADLVLFLAAVGCLQEAIIKICNTVYHYGQNALWNLLPFFTLVICAFIVGYVDVSIWLNMPRTSLHLCAVLFVEMTCELMLTHVTKQTYQPFRYILLPLVIFTILVALGFLQSGQVATESFLLVYTSSAFTFLAMKASLIIHEICSVLNIYCFDIVTTRCAASSISNSVPSLSPSLALPQNQQQELRRISHSLYQQHYTPRLIQPHGHEIKAD